MKTPRFRARPEARGDIHVKDAIVVQVLAVSCLDSSVLLRIQCAGKEPVEEWCDPSTVIRGDIRVEVSP